VAYRGDDHGDDEQRGSVEDDGDSLGATRPGAARFSPKGSLRWSSRPGSRLQPSVAFYGSLLVAAIFVPQLAAFGLLAVSLLATALPFHLRRRAASKNSSK
jgi:hypothetical protein